MTAATRPPMMFGGRMRQSTFVLVVLFAGVCALYLLVRPDPRQPSEGGAQVVPAVVTTPTPTPTVEPRETTTSRRPTPKPSRSKRPSAPDATGSSTVSPTGSPLPTLSVTAVP